MNFTQSGRGILEARPPAGRATRMLVAAVFGLSVIASGPALGQGYPNKPIRMIVPFPPGGSTDLNARILAQAMTVTLGQPIVVENKAGAAGSIGIEAVARSAPDGYTVGVSGVGTTVLLKLLGQKLGFDPERDLIAVGYMGSLGLAIVARTDFEATTVPQLIALAKAKPDTITYATSGSGSPGHLAMEYFKGLTGVQIRHVPYKGDAPILNDLLGHHVDLGLLTTPGAIPQVKSGKVKAVAVTSAHRSSQMPDVPTVAEAGVSGYAAEIWNILVVPAATPAAIVDKLSAALNAALASPAVRAQLEAQGLAPVTMTSKETTEFVQRDREKWAKVVKQSGAKLD